MKANPSNENSNSARNQDLRPSLPGNMSPSGLQRHPNKQGASQLSPKTKNSSFNQSALGPAGNAALYLQTGGYSPSQRTPANADRNELSRQAVASLLNPRSSENSAVPDAHLRNLRDLKERKSVQPDNSMNDSRAKLQSGETTPKQKAGVSGNIIATEGNSSFMQSEARKNLSTR